MALAAYRTLLRSARLAFEGDAPLLAAARLQIRQGFRQQADTNPSAADSQAAIQHAQDVAKILRENVVQGRKTDGRENTYKLRIHEYTERGDNESILTTASKNPPSPSKGCACK